jgi:hypothetical protein
VPGRTAALAIRDYKADLESAFSCLKCFSKLEFNPREPAVGEPFSWMLVAGSEIGIELPGLRGNRLEASQTLTVVERPEQPSIRRFGLTTSRYDYSMSDEKGELWAMHWHPETPNSDVVYPHIHLRQLFGDVHLATGRLLVEHAIHWAIAAGATARYDNWHEKLQETIRKHEEERNWS